MNMKCDQPSQSGFALLIAMMVLSVFAIIGLYLALVSSAEVHISDNFESLVGARAAALAGLYHGRALLRGLRFDDLLEGPDGVHELSPGYVAAARTHAWRTPVGWPLARILSVLDPADALTQLPDDGIISTGRHPSGNGVALIPIQGIAQTAGKVVTSRYFVKISDNNGEPGEMAEDPADNPFHDGDGQIILRSLGIAQTLLQPTGDAIRRNSVAAFEARFKRRSTFDLDAPLVIQGSAVEPAGAEMFLGDAFLIQGGEANPGIGTVDTITGDGSDPVTQISSRLGPAQDGCIQGAGMQPSIRDITGLVSAHPEKRLMKDATFACRFLKESLPQFVDNVFVGIQNWAGSAPKSLGHYDPALPQTSPGQDPRVTIVNGDLLLDGNVEGGGLLVVTGKLTITGRFVYSGLILLFGGELDSGGTGVVTGGILVGGLSCAEGNTGWGTVKLTIRESGQIIFNRETIRMAVTLIPPLQLSFREITSTIDP